MGAALCVGLFLLQGIDYGRLKYAKDDEVMVNSSLDIGILKAIGTAGLAPLFSLAVISVTACITDKCER